MSKLDGKTAIIAELFLMRHAYHCVWQPVVKVTPIHLLKFRPLAFM